MRGSIFVPFVQWIRTERYERSDSGSSPERDTNFTEWWPTGKGASLSIWRGVAKSGLKRSALTRELESSNLSSPTRFLM